MASVVPCPSYPAAVRAALEAAGFAERVRDAGRVIIKPNLLQNTPPPTTTDVRCVEALAVYIREGFPGKEIVIAEGSGGCPTAEAFAGLGYTGLAERYGLTLIDLDDSPVVSCRVADPLVWPEIRLPEPILDGFLVSAAVLKHHTITRVTLSLKNMIGILPAAHYSGYWSYRKSMVHKDDVEKAIRDINRARPIDFALIDAAVGQEGSHLEGGRPFDPPIGRIIAARNPVDADTAGCRLLGVDPKDVEHLGYCRGVYREEK